MKLTQHSCREEHTKRSEINRGHYVPDTAAVKQEDPGIEPTDTFTQTPPNQQTQKISRPGIEIFSQTTREVRGVGEYDKEPTDPRTHPWEHQTLSPTTRSRDREQGTSENQERTPLEQDRGPSAPTPLEIAIEKALQFTLTHPLPNSPDLDTHDTSEGGDRTQRREGRANLTWERINRENMWNLEHAIEVIFEAIWVKQQLIRIQQDRLDKPPNRDIKIRTELRAMQRLTREARKLTSMAEDLLEIHSWHKETWQRRREETGDGQEVIRKRMEDEPTSNGVGQEQHQGRQGGGTTNHPHDKEEIIKGETALQRMPLIRNSKGQDESH